MTSCICFLKWAENQCAAVCEKYFMILKWEVLCRDFPGGPVIKILPSSAGGAGSIPGWGNQIPHAVGWGQKLKKKKSAVSSLGIRVINWNEPWISFLSYLTQLGLSCTMFLNQVLKLIVDVLFSAANLLQSPANFIMKFVQKSLEILWNFSRQRIHKYIFLK